MRALRHNALRLLMNNFSLTFLIGYAIIGHWQEFGRHYNTKT